MDAMFQITIPPNTCQIILLIGLLLLLLRVLFPVLHLETSSQRKSQVVFALAGARFVNLHIMIGILCSRLQTIDTNPIPLEASAPDLPYFKPSSCRLLQKVTGLDDLSEFCVAINGCWVARDKPLERLGQNTKVLLGPITLAGQECKFSEDDI